MLHGKGQCTATCGLATSQMRTEEEPLLQSTKPINQSFQVWPPILAEASNQQSPYIQVKSTNFALPYILAPIGTSHHHVSQYWLEQVSEINTLLKKYSVSCNLHNPLFLKALNQFCRDYLTSREEGQV